MHMQQRILAIAQHLCAAANATCAIDWLPPCPATVNDSAEAAFVKETLTERFGSSRVVESPLVMGSEDFSYFLSACRAVSTSSERSTNGGLSQITTRRSISTKARWPPESKLTLRSR